MSVLSNGVLHTGRSGSVLMNKMISLLGPPRIFTSYDITASAPVAFSGHLYSLSRTFTGLLKGSI